MVATQQVKNRYKFNKHPKVTFYESIFGQNSMLSRLYRSIDRTEKAIKMLTSGYTHFYGINKAKTIEVAASKKIVFDANVTAEFDADVDTEVDDKLDAVGDVMLDAVGDVMLVPRLVPLF